MGKDFRPVVARAAGLSAVCRFLWSISTPPTRSEMIAFRDRGGLESDLLRSSGETRPCWTETDVPEVATRVETLRCAEEGGSAPSLDERPLQRASWSAARRADSGGSGHFWPRTTWNGSRRSGAQFWDHFKTGFGRNPRAHPSPPSIDRARRPRYIRRENIPVLPRTRSRNGERYRSPGASRDAFL
jgi:hypothetical protein